MRTITHGLAELAAHPFRAVLSGLSLVVGVLAVVAIFTISQITAEVFIAASEQTSGKRATYTATLHDVTVDAATFERMIKAAEPLTHSGGGIAIFLHTNDAAGLGYSSDVLWGLPAHRAFFAFTAGDIHDVRRLPLLDGRWYDPNSAYPLELVVNSRAAINRGGVGTEIALVASPDSAPIHGRIVGVVADGTNDETIFVPLAALLHHNAVIFNADTSVSVLLHHRTASQPAILDTARAIARAAGTTLGQDRIQRADQIDSVLAQLRIQQLAFLAAAGLALLVSAVGILNIGLASISERSRELVVRRALGATRAGIIGQVLVAALLIGLVAALIAAAIAIWAVLQFVPPLIPAYTAIEPPGIPWVAIVWGTVAAAATTLIGSIVPALVAARLDVATALRD